MTISAWLMLLTTWTVVLYFTAKFLVKIIRLPTKGPAQDVDGVTDHDSSFGIGE